jgi:hypothetical protein
MKIRIRKMGMSWWIWLPGDIPTLLGCYAHFTDALARLQVECNPLMKAECDRKELGREK